MARSVKMIFFKPRTTYTHGLDVAQKDYLCGSLHTNHLKSSYLVVLGPPNNGSAYFSDLTTTIRDGNYLEFATLHTASDPPPPPLHQLKKYIRTPQGPDYFNSLIFTQFSHPLHPDVGGETLPPMRPSCRPFCGVDKKNREKKRTFWGGLKKYYIKKIKKLKNKKRLNLGKSPNLFFFTFYTSIVQEIGVGVGGPQLSLVQSI